MFIFMLLFTDESKGSSLILTLSGFQDKDCEKLVFEKIKSKCALDILKTTHYFPVEVTEGSVVVHLDPVTGDCYVKLKNSVLNGELTKIIENIFKSDDIMKYLSPGCSCIAVSIAFDKTQSSKVESRKFN